MVAILIRVLLRVTVESQIFKPLKLSNLYSEPRITITLLEECLNLHTLAVCFSAF